MNSYYLSYRHFIATGELKLELLSRYSQFGSERAIFLSRVTLKFDWWPWKTIGHLFYDTSTFVHHFVVVSEFKLELRSGNAQIGAKFVLTCVTLTFDLDRLHGYHFFQWWKKCHRRTDGQTDGQNRSQATCMVAAKNQNQTIKNSSIIFWKSRQVWCQKQCSLCIHNKDQIIIISLRWSHICICRCHPQMYYHHEMCMHLAYLTALQGPSTRTRVLLPCDYTNASHTEMHSHVCVTNLSVRLETSCGD